jgi:hypothetical protein
MWHFFCLTGCTESSVLCPKRVQYHLHKLDLRVTLIVTHTEYKREGCEISVCTFEGRDDMFYWGGNEKIFVNV